MKKGKIYTKWQDFTVRELIPTDGRKSFYDKAVVVDDMKQDISILFSYGTPIVVLDNKNGNFYRCFDGWTATTGRHIAAFCGCSKKQFARLEYKLYRGRDLESYAARFYGFYDKIFEKYSDCYNGKFYHPFIESL